MINEFTHSNFFSISLSFSIRLETNYEIIFAKITSTSSESHAGNKTKCVPCILKTIELALQLRAYHSLHVNISRKNSEWADELAKDIRDVMHERP